MSDLDHGIRCDRHIGEVFPPRCTACDTLTAEYAAMSILPRTRLGASR